MEDRAHVLDKKATELAADYLRTEGELLTILSDMRKQRLFAVLNYSGIFDYCERKLGFSRSQAFYFKSVAEKSDEVPEIKAAVTQGQLTLSQARRIVPVITRANHREWIEKAKTLRQTELERVVTAANPKAHVRETIKPIAIDVSELRVSVDAKTEENLRALRDLLSQKLPKPASNSDVIAWMAEQCRERFEPVRRAARATKVSSGNPSPAKPGRRPIPAEVRHRVALRDRGRCTYVSPDGRRCEERRWIALHHVVEVAKGGLNTAENLQTLCSAHHSLVHARLGDDEVAQRIVATGKAKAQVRDGQ